MPIEVRRDGAPHRMDENEELVDSAPLSKCDNVLRSALCLCQIRITKRSYVTLATYVSALLGSTEGATSLEVAIGFALTWRGTAQHKLVAPFGHSDDLSDHVPR